MTRLFNEEPTIVLNRSSTKSAVDVHLHARVNLTASVKLVSELKIYGTPLLNATTVLLGILTAIPTLGEPQNIGLFRQQLLDELDSFRQRGALLDYHSSIIEKSCFCLCSAFDEAILYTEWGENVRWENNSLLSKVFSQRNGGEAFFTLLEKACEQPGKLVDFIELQYVLLMLGFKGRYRNDDEEKLYQIKSNTYKTIRYFRSEYCLPVVEPALHSTGKQLRKIISAKKVLLIMLILILGGYAVTEYLYFDISRSIIQIIDQINAVSLSGIIQQEQYVSGIINVKK